MTKFKKKDLIWAAATLFHGRMTRQNQPVQIVTQTKYQKYEELSLRVNENKLLILGVLNKNKQTFKHVKLNILPRHSAN